MKFVQVAAAVALAALIAAAPSLADAQGKGQGQGQGQGQYQGKGKGKGNNKDVGRGRGQGNDAHRGRGYRSHPARGSEGSIILNYYSGRRHSCARRLPPGIRKQVAVGRPIPPGLRRNRCRLPYDLRSRLPYREGYGYFVVGTGVAHVNLRTGIIIDVWIGLF